MTRARVIGLIAALVVAAVVGIVLLAGDDDVERVRGLIPWPDDCVEIEISRPSRHPSVRRWQGQAETTADISCENLGGWVAYARFADDDRRVAALAPAPASERVCVAGAEVVVDELFLGGFDTLCQRLNGRLSPPRK